MSSPSDDQPTTVIPQQTVEQPAISVAPATRRARNWHRRIPARIGKARTSTVVIGSLFVLLFALHAAVAPDPVEYTDIVDANTGQTVRVPTTLVPPAPTTAAPTTSSQPTDPATTTAPRTTAPRTTASETPEDDEETTAPETTEEEAPTTEEDEEPTTSSTPTSRAPSSTAERTSSAPTS